MSYINDEYIRKWSEGNNSQLPHAKNIWGGTFQDFINNDGWVNSKTNGKMRLEGKEYIVKDGDVLNFRFNT